MDLGDQLRKEMNNSGLSLLAIAQGTKLDYALVHRFFRKKRDIRMGSAAKLARFLGLELTKKKKQRARGE